MSANVLFVDNYDSFTYNVVHLLAAQGAPPSVILNDDPHLVPALLEDYRMLVVGPGPGNPSEKPRMMSVLRAAIERGMPVFGVCLGLQAIGEALGASVIHAPSQMHGKTSPIEHDGTGVFAGLPSPLVATRYHSLCLDAATLPGSSAHQRAQLRWGRAGHRPPPSPRARRPISPRIGPERARRPDSALDADHRRRRAAGHRLA